MNSPFFNKDALGRNSFTIILFGIAFVLLGAGAFLIYGNPPPASPAAVIPQERAVSAPSTIERVETPQAQELGLGGRTTIPDNYGMLFVFPTLEKYGFWMKDMKVAIDMLWIADDGTVVTLLENVSPATYPSVFYPDLPVKYVLETRAGYAHAYGITKGVRITGLVL